MDAKMCSDDSIEQRHVVAPGAIEIRRVCARHGSRGSVGTGYGYQVADVCSAIAIALGLDTFEQQFCPSQGGLLATKGMRPPQPEQRLFKHDGAQTIRSGGSNSGKEDV